MLATFCIPLREWVTIKICFRPLSLATEFPSFIATHSMVRMCRWSWTSNRSRIWKLRSPLALGSEQDWKFLRKILRGSRQSCSSLSEIGECAAPSHSKSNNATEHFTSFDHRLNQILLIYEWKGFIGEWLQNELGCKHVPSIFQRSFSALPSQVIYECRFQYQSLVLHV